MTEETTKNKIISFRVSDQEHMTIEKASRKYGFTSVALFARSTTLAFDSSEGVCSPIDTEINRIWKRIDVLTAALEMLLANAGVVLGT